jgi:hypothetical protein
MNTTKTLPAVRLLLSDARGIYIPRDFVQGFKLAEWGLDPDEWAVRTCNCPTADCDGYWDAWAEIIDRARYTAPDGSLYMLHQDGDLWALCYERMTDEERSNFGFDE